MDHYGPETYGELIADVYDAWHAHMDPAGTVDVLASLAGDGPVLELGIGTGRVAIPLAARGIEVHGVDAGHAAPELGVAEGEDPSVGHQCEVPVARRCGTQLDSPGRHAEAHPRDTALERPTEREAPAVARSKISTVRVIMPINVDSKPIIANMASNRLLRATLFSTLSILVDLPEAFAQQVSTDIE